MELFTIFYIRQGRKLVYWNGHYNSLPAFFQCASIIWDPLLQQGMLSVQKQSNISVTMATNNTRPLFPPYAAFFRDCTARNNMGREDHGQSTVSVAMTTQSLTSISSMCSHCFGSSSAARNAIRSRAASCVCCYDNIKPYLHFLHVQPLFWILLSG